MFEKFLDTASCRLERCRYRCVYLFFRHLPGAFHVGFAGVGGAVGADFGVEFAGFLVVLEHGFQFIGRVCVRGCLR